MPRWPVQSARWLLPLFLLLSAAGCYQDLNTIYGQSSGMGADSVNGTAALLHMIEAKGHTVTRRTRLTPRLQERAEVIVWFPDDPRPPRLEVRTWLEEWLKASPDRVLVLVGRDFQAESEYWKRMLPKTEGSQRAEYERRVSRAALDRQVLRIAAKQPEDCGWYRIDGVAPEQPIERVYGEFDWRRAFEPRRAAIDLGCRLLPPPEAEVLLSADGGPLVSRIWFEGSQLLLVNNGWFLLNLPLVNREHRKLAGRLIDELGTERKVVFLESFEGGPPITGDDESTEPSTMLALFTIPPFNWIFLHVAAWGAAAVFAAWPIFGAPRRVTRAATAHFGTHVEALGKLLGSTGDSNFAQRQLEIYRGKTSTARADRKRSSSGANHERARSSEATAKPASPTNQP